MRKGETPEMRSSMIKSSVINSSGINKKEGSVCRRSESCKSNDSRTGSDGCSADDHSLAAVLKAMAHPVRIRILRLLHECGESLCSCDIEAHFPLRQPTISHHLKILKDAGLVESQQEGIWVHFTLSKRSPIQVRDILKCDPT